jgi:Ca-activated chloride channel family protein
MNNSGKSSWPKRLTILVIIAFVGKLIFGSITEPNFWLTPNQRGQLLMRQKHFDEASKAFGDPWLSGAAHYRNGDFELAAKSFVRVAGPAGAFDQANAWLMHGDYAKAIHWYDRALQMQPNWTIALENKSIAIARQKRLNSDSAAEQQESAEAYEPDAVKFDGKGDDEQSKPIDLASQNLSDEQLRATWLRRVQTTPADFLRFKFAYQAQQISNDPAPPTSEGTTP